MGASAVPKIQSINVKRTVKQRGGHPIRRFCRNFCFDVDLGMSRRAKGTVSSQEAPLAWKSCSCGP